MMLNKYIGGVIKERRKELEITQVTLAEIAGISKNSIYKLERGISNPTSDVIEKVLDVLGLELSINVKKK